MPRRIRARAATAAPIAKTCRRCGHEKPIADFSLRRRGRIASICRPCDAARARERYWRKPEASRCRRRELRQADPERFREYARARRRRHLEAERARGRAWARTRRGRELNRLAVARYVTRCREKIAARSVLTSAVKRGLVKRAPCCEVLGCVRTELHAHHHDYSKPRDVVWLCRSHHEAAHHEGPQRLKPGSRRKFACPPRLAVRTRRAA